MSAKSTQDRTEEGFAQDLFDKQKAYSAAGVTKTCEWRVESNRIESNRIGSVDRLIRLQQPKFSTKAKLKRIDMDLPSAFFSKFPEMRPSSVPALLDEKLIKVFEDAAA